MSEDVYHIPALLPQSISALNIHPGGIYVDATFGGGGHSGAIAAILPGEGNCDSGESAGGHLYSIDRDSDAIDRATATPVFTPVHGDFRYLANYMRFYGVYGKVDGILADLGVSSHHFDDASRGFSFRTDAPLDMRMNRQGGTTAADLLASADVSELAGWLKTYGELRHGARIAAAIVKARAAAPIDSTGRLAETVRPLLNPAAFKKELAQVFQALRIVVNGEMEALEAFLTAAVEVLRPGGRLAVITYHSLEDRMVKNFMRSGRIDGKIEKDIFGRTGSPVRPLGKSTAPDAAEIEANPRSRSARLRVAKKTDTDSQS